MSTEENVFLAGVLMAMLVAVLVFVFVYPAMRKLLSVNGYMRPACSFYGRTFFLVIFLAAWGPILSHGVPSASSSSPSQAKSPSASATPAPAASAASAAPEATATEAPETFMNAVWYVAGAFKDVCMSVAIFLALYVVLMTIVYAVLGRFRDSAEGEAARS